MNILTAKNIKKIQADGVLFEGIDLGLEEGQKVALIGKNGSGKSTLARILALQEESDEGELTTRKNLKVSVLEQNPSAREGESILDYMFRTATYLNRETTADHRIREVLSALDLPPGETVAHTLSGGTLRRAAIARLLLEEPELMILDEPTNHLDMQIIRALEERLIRFPGAIILITHDRYFLDRIVSTIHELHQTGLRTFSGSYSDYLEQVQVLEEQQQAREKKARSFLRKELEWIQRQPKARGTKQKARIDRYEDVKNREKPGQSGALKLASGAARLGKKILEAERISYAYGQKELFRDFSYTFKERERLGIVGPNGCGKSTLLHILSGRLEPSRGRVVHGETLRIAYFDQMTSDMDPSLRVQDYIKNRVGEVIRPEGEKTMSPSQMLEYFLFDSSALYRDIGKLSGGERRRLYLATLLLQSPNFLILDEPTNDFDIHTLTALESYLDSFSGVVLTVSHDRWFLNRTASQLLVFEPVDEISPMDSPVHTIDPFTGSAQDYLESRAKRGSPTQKSDRTQKTERKSAGDAKGAKDVKDAPKKLGYREKEQYRLLPDQIDALENEKSELENLLSSGQSDPEKLTSWGQRLEAVNEELDRKTELYLELDERAHL